MSFCNQTCKSSDILVGCVKFVIPYKMSYLLSDVIKNPTALALPQGEPTSQNLLNLDGFRLSSHLHEVLSKFNILLHVRVFFLLLYLNNYLS